MHHTCCTGGIFKVILHPKTHIYCKHRPRIVYGEISCHCEDAAGETFAQEESLSQMFVKDLSVAAEASPPPSVADGQRIEDDVKPRRRNTLLKEILIKQKHWQRQLLLQFLL